MSYHSATHLRQIHATLEPAHQTFTPGWWSRNPHLQTCYAFCWPRRVIPLINWEQLDLPDSDFIDLCWAGPADGPVAVLLHGLEGSVDSHYIRLMLNMLVNQGWRVVVMHFRTCSGRINRLSRGYHGGEIDDLSYLLQILRQRLPTRRMVAVGFSLGGHVLLRYLAHNATSPLQCAVTVSAPFELDKCADCLARFYHWPLLRSMKRKTMVKIRQGYAMPARIPQVKAIRDFRHFDELLTAPLHGFASAEDYYAKSSVRNHLRLIKQSTLIIHALDDPLIPVDSIPATSELAQNTRLALSPRGGHVGFVRGKLPWLPEYWLNQRILAFLKNSV